MKLYVYNHCPYCVRVFLILGIKKINCSIEYFSNEDIYGPVSLVGSKQVPILERKDGRFMAESMNIIDYLDNLDNQMILLPTSNRLDLSTWIDDTKMTIRKLMMPRWVQFDEPEFRSQEARNFFTKNKERMIGNFSYNLEQSPLLIKFMNEKLVQLASMFSCDEFFDKGFSLDDIDLWSRLRGLTGVKDLEFPTVIKHYLNYYARKANIKLYYDQQI